MSKFKDVKVTGTEVVVQDNKLVESPRFITLQEQRLFVFLVSKLNPKNPQDTTFRIPIVEFAKAIGGDVDNAYRSVRSIVKKLSSNIITIKAVEDGCKTTTDMPLLGYAKYWHGKGYADIQISDAIAPYLFDLKERYTSYKLTQVTKLSSIYAIRIYELLKQYEEIGKRKLFINDLREKLAIKDSQYVKFNDFKKYVLEIAKREINSKTDLKISYMFQKTAKKFTTIEFLIKSNVDINSSNKNEVPRYHDQTIIDKMVLMGVESKTAKDWFNRYSPVDIENAIKVVDTNIQNGECNNPAGMLKTAIEGRWRPKVNKDNITIEFGSKEDEEVEGQVKKTNTQRGKTKKISKKSPNNMFKKLFSIFDS